MRSMEYATYFINPPATLSQSFYFTVTPCNPPFSYAGPPVHRTFLRVKMEGAKHLPFVAKQYMRCAEHIPCFATWCRSICEAWSMSNRHPFAPKGPILWFEPLLLHHMPMQGTGAMWRLSKGKRRKGPLGCVAHPMLRTRVRSRGAMCGASACFSLGPKGGPI